MNEMVEKVALAICTRNILLTVPASSGISIAVHFDLGRDMWIDMALAAIEAMREPTEAMADKGESSLICGPDPRDLEDAPGMKWAHAKSCWRAMIDAALKE